MCPVHAYDHCTGSCSVCGLWKAKLALNTRGCRGFFAYNVNYSYVVRFKGKSTDGSFNAGTVSYNGNLKQQSGSTTKMKFPLSTPILSYRKKYLQDSGMAVSNINSGRQLRFNRVPESIAQMFAMKQMKVTCIKILLLWNYFLF